MTRLTGLLVITMLTSLALGPGIVVATEDPHFETTVAKNYVTPGQAESLTVTLINDAEDPEDTVEPATNVDVELESGNTPFTVTSGPSHLGTVRDGNPVQVHFAITVPQDIQSGHYTVPVRITYEFDDDERETTRTHVTLRVSDRATFSLVETTGNLTAKSDGELAVTVENVGSEVARDGTLQIESRNTAVAFDGVQTSVRSIGELGPGEQRTVTYSVTATKTAEPGVYPVTGTIKYDDEDGARRASTPLAGTVSVSREQSFAVNATHSNLRVDRDGRVTVSVTNTGPHSIQNGNLELLQTGKSIHPKQTEFSLGTLEPGASTNAQFEVFVDEDATPTPRQLTFQITYDEKDGDRKVESPTSVEVGIDPERAVYDVETVDVTVPAGETESVTVRLTNLDSQTYSSINAKAYTDAPVEITDDSAFVSALEPGESTTLEFRVQAPGDALTKEYPISLDFKYDEPDGDTKLTETYDVPVSVIEGTTIRESAEAYIDGVSAPTESLLGGIIGFVLGTLGVGLVGVIGRRRS